MKGPDLKFLVDVGVGTKAENYLRQEGYDLKAVRAIDPRLPDEAIIHLAIAENRMIVTMDKDFGELVYRWRHAHAGVLLLRMEEATGQEKAEAVAQILEQYSEQIKGRFCVCRKGRLRIRRRS
jgi:predicted nuclease of predicted toxin-antitoxin system